MAKNELADRIMERIMEVHNAFEHAFQHVRATLAYKHPAGASVADTCSKLQQLQHELVILSEVSEEYARRTMIVREAIERSANLPRAASA